MLLLKPTVPCAGCETTRKVSGFPFASAPGKWKARDVLLLVFVVTLLTTAGELLFPSSLDGPL